MASRAKSFDLEKFLLTVNAEGAGLTYSKGDTVFAQGDRCEGVFYIQSGDCKVSVISKARKRSSRCMEKEISLARVVSPGSVCGLPP